MKKSTLNLKIFILLICLLFALLTVSFSTDKVMDQGYGEDLVLHQFLNKTAKYIEKKYSLITIGSGMSGMDKISEIGLAFQRSGDPLTEEQARRLILNCVIDFLDAVNTDEVIRSYLKVYPFKIENVSLKIFDYDEKHNLHQFPYIGVVTNSNGEIGFFTEEGYSSYQYKTKKYETYEEALAIVQKECNP